MLCGKKNLWISNIYAIYFYIKNSTSLCSDCQNSLLLNILLANDVSNIENDVFCLLKNANNDKCAQSTSFLLFEQLTISGYSIFFKKNILSKIMQYQGTFLYI